MNSRYGPFCGGSWCLASAATVLVVAATLLREQPQSPATSVDSAGTKRRDDRLADDWIRGHLTSDEIRKVRKLAARIGSNTRLPGNSQDSLSNDVERLSIREAAALGVTLWKRYAIDPRRWLALPAGREHAAEERLTKLLSQFDSDDADHPSLEKTVRGPTALRELCGDDMLTEITGVGIWRLLDDGFIGQTTFGDNHVDILCDLPGLERLSAEWSYLSDIGIARLATLPRLREFHIAGTQVTDETLRVLGQIREVRVIDVNSVKRISDAGVAALLNCQQLEVLNLENTRVSSESLPIIARLDGLRELSLSKTQVHGGLSQLSTLKSLQRIELARLGTRESPLPSASLEFLSDLKRLQKVSLKGTAIRRITLRNLPQLSVLLLGHETLDDLTLVDLPMIQSLRIESELGTDPLTLSSLQIGGLKSTNYLIVQGLGRNAADGLSFGLATMPNIALLNLKGEMTDELARAIGQLAELKTLGIGQITVTGRQLSEIARAHVLSHLHVGGKALNSKSLFGIQYSHNLQHVQIDDADLENLDFLRQATGVESLRLDRCKVQEIHLNRSDTLSSLDIRQGGVDSLLAEECPQLSSLRLLNSQMIRLGVKSCPRFRKLFCGHSTVAADICLKNLPVLRVLTIQEGAQPGNLVLDELPALQGVVYWAANVNLSHVKALANIPALKILDVSSTRLGNDAAKAIARLKTIEKLSASGRFGIDGLRDITNLPALRQLHLYHNKQCDWTPQQARRLFSHVRHVTVF